MGEVRCVLCGAPVGGFESVVNDRGVTVEVRAALPAGPAVFLCCLPMFVARGGRLVGEGAVTTVREEVGGEEEF